MSHALIKATISHMIPLAKYSIAICDTVAGCMLRRRIAVAARTLSKFRRIGAPAGALIHVYTIAFMLPAAF
jgi:hypothetical protein